MRKTIKRLWLLWMFIIIISFFTTNVRAEHEVNDPPIYDQPGMVKKPVPVYCGPTEFMLNTAIEKFNQEPLVVGKVIIPQSGEVVAMVTVFVHKDKLTDMSVLMTMLN